MSRRMLEKHCHYNIDTTIAEGRSLDTATSEYYLSNIYIYNKLPYYPRLQQSRTLVGEKNLFISLFRQQIYDFVSRKHHHPSIQYHAFFRVSTMLSGTHYVG